MLEEKKLDSINVVMYSYKSKNAIETLQNLMKKRSGKIFIFIHWHDQNGIDRSKLLINLVNNHDNCNGAYVPISWDNIDGAVLYKDLRLKATMGGKYHMTITPGVVLEQDWDLKLINFVENKNIIVSGNQKINILNKNLFFIDKKYIKINDFELTNYIDKNFIFGNVSLMKSALLGNYNFPGWLKYYGEEEILSLQYFNNNIDIYAAPENLIKINRYSTLEDFNYYVPFSKYHNYNEVIRLFKQYQNGIIGALDPKVINNFNKYHNFIFGNLEYLPFPTNDVSYQITDSKYDRIDGSRFIKQINKVD
jgi:hypothetical protein